MLNTLETSRLEKLEDAIYEFYPDMHPRELERLESTYDASIDEMFEVSGIGANSVALTYLFEDETIGPVRMPDPVRRLVRKGDVFLMTLGLKKDVWTVLRMSAPYEDFSDIHYN